MISDNYSCIFVHIPKVAGQSIENFFLKLHNLDWNTREPLLLKYNPDPTKGPERLAHLLAEEYVNCGHTPKHTFDSYFKFAFVRNPWDRLVSEFTYREDYQGLTFKHFVMNRLPKESQYTDSYRHIMPQTKFVFNNEGKQLVDFIGRFENLQQDFAYVCSKLNIPPAILPHINVSSSQSLKSKLTQLLKLKKKTKRLHYTDYYDAETQEIVGTMYAEDIKTFNYTFGN